PRPAGRRRAAPSADQRAACAAAGGRPRRPAPHRSAGAPSVAGSRPSGQRVRSGAAARVPLLDARPRHARDAVERPAQPRDVPVRLRGEADRNGRGGRDGAAAGDPPVPRRVSRHRFFAAWKDADAAVSKGADGGGANPLSAWGGPGASRAISGPRSRCTVTTAAIFSASRLPGGGLGTREPRVASDRFQPETPKPTGDARPVPVVGEGS